MRLVGKAYLAAGQASVCFHTMAILKAYQADLLKDQDEGKRLGLEAVRELLRATDLSLRRRPELDAWMLRCLLLASSATLSPQL